MEVFEIVIALLLGGAILAAVARRIATPYPALVAIAGAALALLPEMTTGRISATSMNFPHIANI